MPTTKSTPSTTSNGSTPPDVVLTGEAAAWICAILFPDPETGRTGIQLNPAAPDFMDQAAFLNNVKSQLQGP